MKQFLLSRASANTLHCLSAALVPAKNSTFIIITIARARFASHNLEAANLSGRRAEWLWKKLQNTRTQGVLMAVEGAGGGGGRAEGASRCAGRHEKSTVEVGTCGRGEAARGEAMRDAEARALRLQVA